MVLFSTDFTDTKDFYAILPGAGLPFERLF